MKHLLMIASEYVSRQNEPLAAQKNMNEEEISIAREWWPLKDKANALLQRLRWANARFQIGQTRVETCSLRNASVSGAS